MVLIESRKRWCKMLYFVTTELYILSGLLFRKCKIVVYNVMYFLFTTELNSSKAD